MFGLSDLEEMVPWEREIYITLMNQRVQEERERLEEAGHG